MDKNTKLSALIWRRQIVIILIWKKKIKTIWNLSCAQKIQKIPTVKRTPDVHYIITLYAHNHTQTSGILWILSFIWNRLYSDFCKLDTHWTLIDDDYFHIFLAELNWKILVYIFFNWIWLIESGKSTLGFLQKIWKNHWL